MNKFHLPPLHRHLLQHNQLNSTPIPNNKKTAACSQRYWFTGVADAHDQLAVSSSRNTFLQPGERERENFCSAGAVHETEVESAKEKGADSFS